MFNKNNISWREIDALRDCVKSYMSEERYIHTLGVEQESEKLAEIFEYSDDISKINAAALLHDITKELLNDAQLGLCRKYDIKLSEQDMCVPKSWHAKTAAYVAQHEFNADYEIFNAIYYHTFGAPYEIFDLAAKIIYFADWIEPNRTFKLCIEVREWFYRNIENANTLEDKYKVLDKAILLSLDKTIVALINDRVFIHEDTLQSRNSFISCGDR